MEVQNSGEVEEHFKMSDGFDIFCRHWYPSGEIKGVVIFLHGIEVHSGAFRFMGHELEDAGFEVFAFDRRGSGNSKEPNLHRGDTTNFDRHLLDLDEVVESVKVTHKKKSLFIFGHSIGCTYALWYAVHYPHQLDGLILAAPPVETGFKLDAQDTFKVVLSPVVSSHSMFDFIDKWPEAFKEGEEYKLISDDELCTKNFGLGFLFSLQTRLANKMLHYASKIVKPVLVIHGDADVIALSESSNQLMEKLASNDKTLKIFPGADHWFYQSIIPTMSSKYTLEQKKEVSSTVESWLEKQTANQSASASAPPIETTQ
jgi:alpha-beta hydrolase superfamily lysophospholipase